MDIQNESNQSHTAVDVAERAVALSFVRNVVVAGGSSCSISKSSKQNAGEIQKIIPKKETKADLSEKSVPFHVIEKLEFQ